MAALAHPVVTPEEVARRLRSGGELALLDVRDLEAHRAGHALWAARLSPAQLEQIDALVPRRGTPIVLVDVAADDAGPVLGRLRALGYTDIAVLGGGNAAWRAAGHELVANLCVPSKALAERARAVHGTPEVTVDGLAAEIEAGEEPLVLDVRTAAEHRAGTIPGAVSCPGGELVHRAFGLVERGRSVIVTCAGRTRAIFGAQTLRDAGLDDVAFLAGGTTAWAASGRELERGVERPAARPGVAGAARAEAAVAAIARNVAFRVIDRGGLETWLRKAGQRTLYLIDPRIPAPSLHPLVRAIAGGQLLEAVDEHLGVLGARIVLVDEPPFTRAIPLGLWLERYGAFEVAVATEDDVRALLGDPAQRPATAVAQRYEEWSLGIADRILLEPGPHFRDVPVEAAA